MSVEDLFKDDPPLNLPIIQGLEDYVPPEEFVDDALIERIENAEDKTSSIPNKAARNIPKRDSIAPLKPLLKKTSTTSPLLKKKKSGQ